MLQWRKGFKLFLEAISLRSSPSWPGTCRTEDEGSLSGWRAESHLELAEQRLAEYRREPSGARSGYDLIDRLAERAKKAR